MYINNNIITHRIFSIHGRRGVMLQHQSDLTPPSSLRNKPKPSRLLRGIERILIIIEYPESSQNITVLLNSHPSITMSLSTLHLTDETAQFANSDLQESQLWSDLGGDNESFVLAMLTDPSEKRRLLGGQFELEQVKVIGGSLSFTSEQMENWFSLASHHFERYLRRLSALHLPVCVVLMNTAPVQGNTHQTSRTGFDVNSIKNNIIMAIKDTSNVSLLLLEQHQLSPRSFLTQVCAFLKLSCPKDYLDSVTKL